MKKQMYLWDKMAKSFHVTSTHSRAHVDKYKKIAKLILAQNPRRVLDLGCGSGILEKELLELGFQGEIVAIDGSESMLEIANKIVNNPKCHFAKGDLDRGILAAGNFDVIVSINLFFFLSEKKQFLANVREKLSDNNSLFFLVTPKPNRDASNWAFIKAHYASTTFAEKTLITLTEIVNIPRFIHMAYLQSKVSVLAENGVISFDSPESIKKMAESVKLEIVREDGIHANQNWFLTMKGTEG